MAWNSKYWDILSQLYWTPAYLGLRSIPQRLWQRREGLVCVPSDLVNQYGPLYSRARRDVDLRPHLNSQEEILNHVFDIAFAIAPDALIADAFLTRMAIADSGPFTSIGREVAQRYGWPDGANVTQHDGFFISDRSAFGVELKLGSRSWPGQVAKYLALLTWEELHVAAKQNVGLLFIVPASAMATHWSHCGLTGPRIEDEFFEQLRLDELPSVVRALFEEQSERVRSIARRLRLEVLTWSEFVQSLKVFRSRVDDTNPGGQTLRRLLDGLIAQVEAHKGTGI